MNQAAPLFSVHLTQGEVDAWRRREPLTVSQWAEQFRIVTDGPEKGPWRNQLTPHLVEPMDTWGMPHIRKVIVVGTDQSGKTQILYNCWGYSQDYLQAWSMIVMADEQTAGKVSNDRLQPIIKESPALARLMTASPLDLNKNTLRLKGSITYMAWATSPVAMATFPIENVFGDEVDKWGSWKPTSQYADPVAQMEARTTTFVHTGKALAASTCTTETGPIWVQLMKCQEIRVYMARCPDCGKLQIMQKDQVKWPAEAEADPDRIWSEALAWYECKHCSSQWNEAKRKLATRLGAYRAHRWDPESRWWIPAEPKKKPISVGFHFSAFYSPFVPLGKIAAMIIKAQSDEAANHELHNAFLALPYRNERASRVEDEILLLADQDMPAGLVPAGSLALIAVVDVQHNGFYFTIRAWYPGLDWQPGQDPEPHLVRHGFVQSWAALQRVLFKDQYRDVEGRAYVINFGLVDSGDGTKSREIYDWCAKNPPIMPSKGGKPSMAQPYRVSNIATHPGLPLYVVNSNHYKNILAARLTIAPHDPSAWMLHSDLKDDQPGALNDYARQMVSERRNDQGIWEKIPHRANHYLDCEVGHLVAYDIAGIAFLEPETEEPEEEPQTQIRSYSRW
jgi:phage terminase large subunit GpA-like protein